MARAIATCTCEHCGATFEKETTKRNTSEATRWEKWAVTAFTVCPACEQKEREEKVAKLAAEAKAAGLPQLIGSSKQVAWAEQIRADFAKGMDWFINDKQEKIQSWERRSEMQRSRGEDPVKFERSIEKGQEDIKFAERIKESFLSTKKEASWWIDGRDVKAADYVRMHRLKVLAKEGEQA